MRGERGDKGGVGVIFVTVSVLLSVWFGFFFISLISECVLEKNPFEDGCMEVAELVATERAQKFVEKIFSLDLRTLDTIENIEPNTVKLSP